MDPLACQTWPLPVHTLHQYTNSHRLTLPPPLLPGPLVLLLHLHGDLGHELQDPGLQELPLQLVMIPGEETPPPQPPLLNFAV